MKFLLFVIGLGLAFAFISSLYVVVTNIIDLFKEFNDDWRGK